MTSSRFIIWALGAVAIAGCAAHPDPIIDMKGVDPNALAKDWEECESYTQEILISQGVLKGGATGAVVGALGGAIDGDAGKGPDDDGDAGDVAAGDADGGGDEGMDIARRVAEQGPAWPSAGSMPQAGVVHQWQQGRMAILHAGLRANGRG